MLVGEKSIVALDKLLGLENFKTKALEATKWSFLSQAAALGSWPILATKVCLYSLLRNIKSPLLSVIITGTYLSSHHIHIGKSVVFIFIYSLVYQDSLLL
jgi:hypothetical protein